MLTTDNRQVVNEGVGERKLSYVYITARLADRLSFGKC
jgi:hypothetical protein